MKLDIPCGLVSCRLCEMLLMLFDVVLCLMQ